MCEGSRIHTSIIVRIVMLIVREWNNICVSIRLGLRLGLCHIRRIEVVVSVQTLHIERVQPPAPLALDDILSPPCGQLLYRLHFLRVPAQPIGVRQRIVPWILRLKVRRDTHSARESRTDNGPTQHGCSLAVCTFACGHLWEAVTQPLEHGAVLWEHRTDLIVDIAIVRIRGHVVG